MPHILSIVRLRARAVVATVQAVLPAAAHALTANLKKTVKSKLELPHEELLDGAKVEAEQFNLQCPNLATEDTYDDGGEDEVRGWHEDGVGEVAAAKRFIVGVV